MKILQNLLRRLVEEKEVSLILFITTVIFILLITGFYNSASNLKIEGKQPIAKKTNTINRKNKQENLAFKSASNIKQTIVSSSKANTQPLPNTVQDLSPTPSQVSGSTENGSSTPTPASAADESLSPTPTPIPSDSAPQPTDVSLTPTPTPCVISLGSNGCSSLHLSPPQIHLNGL